MNVGIGNEAAHFIPENTLQCNTGVNRMEYYI
jgi:hypothetical protein